MSITNEPKYRNGLLQAIREQLEHRALWMYLLCDEAKKKDWSRSRMPRRQSAAADCIRAQTWFRRAAWGRA